jgi:hypothetical protein
MRHARADDLERLGELLVSLRALPRLKERTPGSFYLAGKGFLHFHIDGDDVWADVKVPGPEFDRRRATTSAEQRALVRAIATHLGPG